MRTLAKSTDCGACNVINTMTDAGLQLSEHAGKIAGVNQTRDDVQLAACDITGIYAFHVEVLDVGAKCVAKQMDDACDDLKNYPLNFELRPQKPDEALHGPRCVTSWSKRME